MSEPKLMANSLKPCCGNAIPHAQLIGQLGGRSLWGMWCQTCLNGIIASSMCDVMQQWNTRHSATEGQFTAEVPTEQDWYWHWNGDVDCAPFPISVLYSGTSGKCFVSSGQLGITSAIDCDKYGGYWLRMQTPAVK